MEENCVNFTRDCPLAGDVKKKADIMHKENAKNNLENLIGKTILEEIKMAENRGERSIFALIECACCKGIYELREEDVNIVLRKILSILRNRGFKADYLYKYEMIQRVIFHISWDDN